MNPVQGLNQDFKTACPKQQFQSTIPSTFIYSATSDPLYIFELNLIIHCIKKDNLHFCHVLEDSLSGKDLVITTQKCKIEKFSQKFLPVNF